MILIQPGLMRCLRTGRASASTTHCRLCWSGKNWVHCI